MEKYISNVRIALDGGSIAVAGASLLGWLPPLAAGASLIWTVIQVWDYFSKKNKRSR